MLFGCWGLCVSNKRNLLTLIKNNVKLKANQKCAILEENCMFDNVGEKLKIVSKIILFLGIIGAIALIIIGIIVESFALFLLISVLSLIPTIISSWAIYAIGETNSNSNASLSYLREISKNINKKSADEKTQTSKNYKKPTNVNYTQRKPISSLPSTTLEYFKNNKSGFLSNNKE